MNLTESVNVVIQWLDVVHVESAGARVAEAHAAFTRSETRGEHLGTDFPVGELGRVSLHEAAHAVAQYKWGATNVNVRIRADGSGIVTGEPETRLGLVVGLLAAPIAELLFTEPSAARRFVLAHGSDIVRAALEIRSIPGISNRSAAIFSAYTVWENRALIDRVSVALHAAGELTHASIVAMCGRPN